MLDQIQNVSLIIQRQKTPAEEFQLKLINQDESFEVYGFSTDEMTAEVSFGRQHSILTGRLSLNIKTEPFRENNLLSETNPISINIHLKNTPKSMTAMYLHRDWWTRPAFISSFEDMPERTQALYIRDENDSYAYFMPMPGTKFKTVASPGTENCLSLKMTAYKGGFANVEEEIFRFSEAKTLYSAIHEVFESITSTGQVMPKSKRVYPEMFDYLGWCSWDAFYTDIDENKVRQKAKEIKDKEIPVRWFLMDDGWLSVNEQLLYSFEPEKKKFPNGFSSMIEDIKGETNIDWFGVWHAFGGYWGGIDPNSSLAETEKNHLYATDSGKLLPYPEAERGYGFFKDWYLELSKSGIDFVKVDGQSAIKNYYENELPVVQAARQSHLALEGATSAILGNRLINCMGMAMENVLNRPGSALTRNSDDFVPNEKKGFQEHILQNTYNALYHDELYYCDWDMFWSKHQDSKKHAVLRAISGGPVYVSDQIGESIKSEISPLVFNDGRILRMDRTAKPSSDCIFSDPQETGVIKLTNTTKYDGISKAGAIAIFNINEDEQAYSISGSDIFDLDYEGPVYVYDVVGHSGEMLTSMTEEISLEIEQDDYALFLVIPIKNGIAPIGLTEKYISILGMNSVFNQQDQVIVELQETGNFSFYSEQGFKKLIVNSVDCTNLVTNAGNLYTIQLQDESTEKVFIQILK